MPCSRQNLDPTVQNGDDSICQQWPIIEKALREPVQCVEELKTAILSYNTFQRDFKVIEYMCENDLFPDGGTDGFFKKTLPELCTLALNLPVYITKPITLLKAGHEHSLTFNQIQIASLLANAFLCTYPDRKYDANYTDSQFYHNINFSNLLSLGPIRTRNIQRILNIKVEKLRCFVHYFNRVVNQYPTGTVTFTRRCLSNRVPHWDSSDLTFDRLELHFNVTCSLFEAGSNTLQMDFANAHLGGGVLRAGCVQEEILFSLRPELLVSRLFTERLGDDEAMIVEGAEQYSNSVGYAESFRWAEDFDQSKSGMTRDDWGRWNYAITMIDATHYTKPENQYQITSMLRELNKAYCGFTDDAAPYRKLPSVVASGNWGCGAYRGNIELKFILQCMACLQAGKSLAYYTFGDEKFCDRAYALYKLLVDKCITIAQTWQLLCDYVKHNPKTRCSLFDYFTQQLISR